MSTKIITIVNQKGGVGKSTTAIALAAGLHRKGYRVLSIDLDAQANLTFSLGVTADNATAFEMLTRKMTAAQVIRHTNDGDLIPANNALAGADVFLNTPGKQYHLKEAIKDVASAYEFIVIDTPPALGVLAVNALTACTSVIIPAQADIFSMQGIEQLAGTILDVKTHCNSNLTISGILLTRYNARSVLSRGIATRLEEAAKKMGTHLYNARIREAIAIKEAQTAQQSLYNYAPGALVTWDYKTFLDEFLTTQGQ